MKIQVNNCFGIIFRYILKKLLTVLLIISPIIILMVWLTISIRYIDLIVLENISIYSFFKLIICVFPEISSVILPVCCLISVIIVLSRLQSDKELLVFMSSGKSQFSLFSPILVFSIFVSSIILYFQTSLSPYSYRSFVDIQEKIRTQISMSIIKPGVFNVLGSSVIYIGEKTDNSISDIFISYIPKDKRKGSNVITAKNGKYVIDKDSLYISLEKGYRQELDENNSVISVLKFDNFSYDVTQYVKRYNKKIEKPYEKTQSELLRDAKITKNKKMKNKYIAEYHGRIIMPFVPIINSIIISIFMLNASGIARRRAIGGMRSFFAGVSCQILIMTLINASSKNNNLISFNYITICILIFVSGYILLKGKKA